jgi:hypothetical protein
MFETLLRTVFSLSVSCLAISKFARPLAINSRISRSRAVSSGNGSGGAGELKNCRSRPATPAPKMASPAATASIACRISCSPASLST